MLTVRTLDLKCQHAGRRMEWKTSTMNWLNDAVVFVCYDIKGFEMFLFQKLLSIVFYRIVMYCIVLISAFISIFPNQLKAPQG